MKYLRFSRIFSVLFALTLCTSYVHAQTTLTASPTTINLSCTIGQACTANSGSIVYSASSTLTATSSGSPSAPFTVAAPSVPWLTLTVPPSPDTGSENLTFTVTPAWTSLNTGLNTTTVTLSSADASGNAIVFTVNLLIQEATPVLTVKGGLNTLNPAVYLTGNPAPVLSLTLLSSSGLPVPFTASASSTETAEGVQNWLTAQTTSGIAYSWGTTISFTTGTAATLAAPGEILTGQITITPSGASAIVLPVNINVSAGAPVITANGVSPSLVPLLANGVTPGFVTFVLKGTGFISSPATQKTKVFYGATAATCSNQILSDYVTILNANYIQVQVPYTSAGAPFATAGATAFVIGVANGQSPVIATSTATVGVTSAPIISGITSASTFVQAAPGTNSKVAPYDIVSIFGNNLCPLCTGTNNVLVGAPDSVYFRFPTFLSPDGTHKITVTFSKPGASTTNLPGYLLFATNNQINVAVPGALSTLEGTTAPNVGLVNVQVGYDTATPAVNVSATFPVAYAAVDPGIFTIESSGQGQAAILDNSTFDLNSATHPADTTGGATPTVQIYLTGLGIPDSAVTNSTTATSGSWAAGTFNCIAPTGGAVGSASNVAAGPGSYEQTVNTPATWNPINTVAALETSYVVPNPVWSSIDGAVLSTAFLNANVAVPCFLGTDTSTSADYITVTIGTGTPTVMNVGTGLVYAGFVPNSIAGLYQIDVTIPTASGTGTAAQYPVTVSINGTTPVSTQSGVTMWLK